MGHSFAKLRSEAQCPSDKEKPQGVREQEGAPRRVAPAFSPAVSPTFITFSRLRDIGDAAPEFFGRFAD
jgi:hypothetical protein